MVLTPPEPGKPGADRSPFRVGSETLADVQRLAASAAGKKGKKVADGARDALHDAFAAAESLLKRVYVQHPNYDHIVKALLQGGLEGLAEQLPLTVGQSRAWVFPCFTSPEPCF